MNIYKTCIYRMGWRGPLCALALGLLLAPALRAQSVYSRGSDTRTAVPEAVMAERKVWGVDLSFGGSSINGNAHNDYLNGGFSLFRADGRSTVYLMGSANYSAYKHVTAVNQGVGTFRYDYTIAAPWKVFVINTNSYSDAIRLNYRSITGAGLWYDLDWGASKHGISLALSHEYEAFRSNVHEQSWLLSLRSLSHIPISNVAALEADLFYVPKADEFADYHLFASLALRTMVWKDNLGLKLAWTDEYDSRPRPGIKHNDTMLTTSLTLHFGR